MVLLWAEPRERLLTLALQYQAWGALDPGALTGESLGQALRMLRNGHMWFSRSVMQELLQTAQRQLAARGARPDRAERQRGPSAASAQAPAPLTAREQQVFELMRCGCSNKEIAAQLAISVNTVKKHLAAGFDKAGLRRRRQALV